ncbi:MAG: peptidoglycan-binding domain-containing protein [Prochlorothrix sp.]
MRSTARSTERSTVPTARSRQSKLPQRSQQLPSPQPPLQPLNTLCYAPGALQPIPCYRNPKTLALALKTPTAGRGLTPLEVWDVTARGLEAWSAENGRFKYGSAGYWGFEAGNVQKSSEDVFGRGDLTPWQRLRQWGSMALTLCLATWAGPGQAVGFQGTVDSILAYGSEGDAVARLQYRLLSLGYLDTCITGFLGPETEASIVRFQRASGLVADGIAGPETQAALFSSQDGGDRSGPVSSSPTGENIVEIQSLLQEWGYYWGAIDGIRGPVTEAAIREFQADRGLVVDGIVGAATWQALLADSAGDWGGSASSGGAATGGSFDSSPDWELPPPPSPGFYEEPIDPLPSPFPPDFS